MIEGSYPFSSNCFLGGVENYLLCKAMVDHDQERVNAQGSGKVSHKVTRDPLEWAGSVGLDQSEWGEGGMCVCLVLLACGTAFNVLAHELHENGPLEISGDKLTSFEITGVPGGLMVMAADKNRVVEGVLWGDIDTPLVYKDMIVIFPVRETRLEGSRDILQGCLQVLENERVRLERVTDLFM